MGRNLAYDLANSDLELEKSIGFHLRGNFYPPLPISMVKPCVDALKAACDGDWYLEIELPEGISFRGKNTAPASEIIEVHRLNEWLENEE